MPELTGVPEKYVHSPWEMNPEMQQQSGCVIGSDYPEPIIDRKWARERTLAAYKEARELDAKGRS